MPTTDSDPLFFSCTSHPGLAEEIVQSLGLKLGNANIERFPDGEISVQIMDNVRGKDVFVIQSPAHNPNFYLMELLIVVDAIRRASARSIVAVLPYFAYCRQDRKDKARVPITAKLVANLISNAGVTRVLTMELHALQVQGFFDIPVDNLFGRPPLVSAVEASGDIDVEKLVIVTPDIGGVKLGHEYASELGVELAVVQKHRVSATTVESSTLIGDVTGKDVLLADDMCSTAGTLASAAKACQEKGANRIFASITHGLFVGDAMAKIEASPIEKLFVSNTIAISDEIRRSSKIEVVSVGELFAQAIQCILSAQSISSLFEIPPRRVPVLNGN